MTITDEKLETTKISYRDKWKTKAQILYETLYDRMTGVRFSIWRGIFLLHLDSSSFLNNRYQDFSANKTAGR
jgi:hypothetical protein